MSNEITLIPVSEITTMAKAIATSGLFGVKSEVQALALMLVAQAEGLHPAQAANDYHIVSGRPTKKAEAMLRDFLRSGGKVEWHRLDDTCADATFAHPAGGTVRISWDLERVKKAQISNAAMYSKYPRAMLRSRVVSEGVRTVCPAATSGMYVPEEQQDIEDDRNQSNQPITITQSKPVPPTPIVIDDLTELANAAKQFAVEIELCDVPEKLEALVKRNAVTTEKLATKLSKWHTKLIALLEKKRASFAATESQSTDERVIGSELLAG